MMVVRAMIWFVLLWISLVITATDEAFDIHSNTISSSQLHQLQSTTASSEESTVSEATYRPEKGLSSQLPAIFSSFCFSSSPTSSSSPSCKQVTWLDILTYTTAPLLFVMSVTGNTLILRVMMSRASRQMTVSHVLGAMSIADLILGFASPFTKSSLTKLFGYDVKGLSVFGCGLFYWFYRTAKFFSAWLLALVAIERFVAVYFPTHMKRVFSKRNAYVAMTTILIALSVFDAFWGVNADRVVSGVCLNNSTYKIFGFVMSSFFLYSTFPSAVMVTMNACVIYRLIVLDRKKRRQVGGVAASAAEVQATSYSKSQKITTVLLTLNAAFIILTNPSSIVYLYSYLQGQNIYQISDQRFIIFREISLIMEQMNYSFNVFFYFTFNKSFRDALRKMLPCFGCKCKKVPAVPSVQPTPSIY